MPPQQKRKAQSGDRGWPAMTKQEMVAEIERASGPETPLQSVRDALPTSGKRPAAGGAGAARGRGVTRGATPKPAPVAAGFTAEQRLTVIDQALLMLETMYANLPLKRALHAIDPLQRLRLLRLRHESLDEREFQSEMIDIFVRLRDLHTNYVLPTVYHEKLGYLPFRVEEFYEGADHQRKYLVSWVSPKNTDTKLVPGLQVTHWNGMPIDLAVLRHAEVEAGSNMEARRAQGLDALTLRWFGMSLPPDEDWVVLTYIDASGKTQESRFAWAVISPQELRQQRERSAIPGSAEKRARIGVDLKTEVLRRVRKTLFDPQAVKAETEMAAYRSSNGGGTAKTSGATRGAAKQPAQPRADVSILPDVYPAFGQVTTPSGTFGYIRLATFSPEDDRIDSDKLIDMAVQEFVRILRTLPPSGLILDVRGNGGGYINFGERLLQTMSPRPITPESFHFATSAVALQVATTETWLQEWKQPLEMAISTGAGFSQGFPLSDPAQCNEIGQVYQGPVVLITDAFCYSTTDIFTAGFQDHQVGTILGVHNNTGAGGANVWDHGLLQQLSLQPNPFVELPGGASMRAAARRSTRVGTRSGVPVEDLGVVPDERYYMTRKDLLEGNSDLIARAAAILKGKKSQTLKLATTGTAPFSQVQVTSTNIDRVDLFVDGRPVVSSDVGAGGSTKIAVPKPIAAKSRVEAVGYRKGELVARARL